MFHRFAMIFNSLLFLFCFSSYYAKGLRRVYESIFLFVMALWKWSSILFTLKCIVLFAVFSFLLVFIIALVTKIKVGKVPVNGFLIAYKYGHSDSVTSSSVYSDNELLQGYEKVHICYERRVGPFGIAHGAIIGQNIEQLNQETKNYLELHGYQTFFIKPINNAVYISCPTLPWLFFFGVWLVLRILYPKMYKFSKARKLSAYPVIEIYSRFSVLLMAPLSRQDDCVVPEADSLLNRSCSRLDISSFSTTSNLSRSVSYDKSSPCNGIKGCDSSHPIGLTEVDSNNVAKMTPKDTSINQLSNGHIKQKFEE